MNNFNQRKNTSRSLLATIVLVISMLGHSSAFKVWESSIKVTVSDARLEGNDSNRLNARATGELSVLIETGYFRNPQDERNLTSFEGANETHTIYLKPSMVFT